MTFCYTTETAWGGSLAKVVRLKTKKIDRQKKDRFRLLVEAVDSIRDYAIFMLDPEGNILTWNLGAERIKGYKPKEIIGKHFSIFYTQEDLDREHPRHELKEAKKFGRYEEEAWRVTKTGTRIWANVVITKLTDNKGKLLGFSKVTRDLTDRKAAEEKLRESEERFRLLVSGVKDYAIYMLDPTGHVSSWNDGATRINGYKEKEILGKHFSIFYPREDVQAGKCDFELKEATRVGKFEDEGWRIKKDGAKIWANVVITAIRDPQKKLLGFTKVIRDLSERKKAENKLQHAYADLEKRILERTADLEVANASLQKREKSLEEALKVRDEFISIASHELKTPITSLQMQLQMLRQKTDTEKISSPDPVKLAKSLDMSLSQVARLTKLIDSLLDVARAQSQKLEFHFEKTDLVRLTNEVIERLSDQTHMAGCQVTIESDPEVVGAFDRFRLDQVIINLMTNAIKYAPKLPINISVYKKNKLAILSIQDKGPGIPEELKSRLFERFERAENVRDIGGLGLGLFITKQIVEGHQGKIRVENQPECGVRFTVEFPTNLAVN